MAVHYDAESLTRAVKARIARYEAAAISAVDHVAVETHKDMVKLLSGRLSYAELRARNAPYGRGRRNPRGKVRGRAPRLPVNTHSGRLRAGLKLVKRGVGGRFAAHRSTHQWRHEVHGVSYAQYIIPKKAKPGSVMVYRGFWEEAARKQRANTKRLRPEFKRRARTA